MSLKPAWFIQQVRKQKNTPKPTNIPVLFCFEDRVLAVLELTAFPLPLSGIKGV